MALFMSIRVYRWAAFLIASVEAMIMWDTLLMRIRAADPAVVCFNEPSSPSLHMFVEELTIPPVLDVGSGSPITLGAYKISQKLHRDLPSTTLYAFGTSQETAHYPGPTLEARRWVATRVTWENRIDDSAHFLPIDNTLGNPKPQRGGVPLVVHLHGGEVPSYSDGHPEAWFTSRGETGQTFITQNYLYPNTQPPATLWYHDHTDGMNRLNVAAGLFGLYIIRSPYDEANLALPSGSYEVSLVFQDKRFFDNGHISFPSVGSTPSIHPAWCPDSFGDTMVVNGKIWPFFNVQPRKYRFRMLNGNTERYLLLSLVSSRGSDLIFCQIGTDGGYLPQPQYLETILLASAERADVIIDFSNLPTGTEVVLTNSARAPYPDGSRGPGNTRMVLKFIVVAKTATGQGTADPPIPMVLRNQESLINLISSAKTRTHRLLDVFSGTSSIPVQLLMNYLRWKDSATEVALRGSTEIWEFINLTNEAHPIHIHLVNFQVINLQRFDVKGYSNDSCSIQEQYPNAGSCFNGYPESPLPFLVGWKDTITILPGFITRIAIRFATQDGSAFSFDATAAPGYLWHCHLLGHEDNDMMRPLLLN